MSDAMPRFATLEQIAVLCRAEPASGLPLQARVEGLGALDEAGENQVSWLSDAAHAKSLSGCRAAAVIGTRALLGDFPRALYVADPEAAAADVLDFFHLPRELSPGIHPTAFVDPGAEIGRDVRMGPHVVVGRGAVIGSGTRLHAGVSIGAGVRVGKDCVLHDRTVVYDRCTIGDRVILHAGVVIGADGFGYIFRGGAHRRLAHLGTVEIEDDVEIGANATLDRGKLGATRIGRGTKIDNLCMIAHNVRIGPCCIIIAQCGIAGSATLGAGVVMGGQSGVTQGVRVGDGVRVGAKSVVQTDIAPGMTVWGVPAQEQMTEKRERARVRMLPKLFDRVSALEKRLAQLEASADHRKSG